MSDENVKSEIVGTEGLGESVAAVASQVSALEKQMTTQFAGIRELMGKELERVALDLRRLEESRKAWGRNHEATHIMENTALAEAKATEAVWRANANEWREESKDRTALFATKSEIEEIVRRLEALIQGNADDLKATLKAPGGYGERLGAVEKFTNSIQTQIGTTRAIVGGFAALIILVVTIAGFVLANK